MKAWTRGRAISLVLIASAVVAVWALVAQRSEPNLLLGAKVVVLPLDGCSAWGVSSDGRFITVACDQGRTAALWNEKTGLKELPKLPDVSTIVTLGTTPSGMAWGSYNRKAGQGTTLQPFTWSAATGLVLWRWAGAAGSGNPVGRWRGVAGSELWLRSSDEEGNLLFGSCEINGKMRAVTLDTNSNTLRQLAEPESTAEWSVASAASADGKVVVGQAMLGGRYFVVLWGPGPPKVLFRGEEAPGGDYSVGAMSRDGRFLAVRHGDKLTIWSSDGSFEIDGSRFLPPKKSVPGKLEAPNVWGISAISDGGEFMVGYKWPGMRPIEPLVWTPELGLRAMSELLPTRVDGFALSMPTGMSRDGRVIVGNATRDHKTRPFVITRR